jgi:quinol monooxygenase YgiN
MPVHYTLILKSKPGLSVELKLELDQLMEPTLREPSCVQVSFFQDADDENCFIFYEVWFDEYGFESHTNQHYIQRFLNTICPKLTDEIVFHKMNQLANQHRVFYPEQTRESNRKKVALK